MARKRIRLGCLGILFIMPILFGPENGYGESPVSESVIELDLSDKKALSELGRGVVGKALSAEPITDTAALMPLRKGIWTYRLLPGDQKGANQEDVITRSKHGRSGISWRRVIGKKCIEYFLVTERGDIKMVTEVDLEEDVLTRYRPAFSMMFNGMRPGEKSEVETDIRVYDLHDPTHEKYRGHLKVTHTYIGAYEVNVPAGRYSTVLIKSSYEGKVGPATVRDVGYAFYAAGVGMVASIERMRVTAFLVYDKRTRTPKVLVHAN